MSRANAAALGPVLRRAPPPHLSASPAASGARKASRASRLARDAFPVRVARNPLKWGPNEDVDTTTAEKVGRPRLDVRCTVRIRIIVHAETVSAQPWLKDTRSDIC